MGFCVGYIGLYRDCYTYIYGLIQVYIGLYELYGFYSCRVWHPGCVRMMVFFLGSLQGCGVSEFWHWVLVWFWVWGLGIRVKEAS